MGILFFNVSRLKMTAKWCAMSELINCQMNSWSWWWSTNGTGVRILVSFYSYSPLIPFKREQVRVALLSLSDQQLPMTTMGPKTMKYRHVERIKQFLMHPRGHSCDICPWKESQTIETRLTGVIIETLLISCHRLKSTHIFSSWWAWYSIRS